MASAERIPVAQFSSEEFKKLHAFARAHAARQGRPHLAEDFASYCSEQLIVRDDCRYNLHWLWSTFLRDNLGNLRNKKGLAKSKSTKYVPIEEARFVADKPTATDGDDWSTLLGALDKDARVVAVLKYRWGFTDRETAEVLGCSFQWVGQLNDQVVAKCGKLLRRESWRQP